jgi:hypothetical protein
MVSSSGSNDRSGLARRRIVAPREGWSWIPLHFSEHTTICVRFFPPPTADGEARRRSQTMRARARVGTAAALVTTALIFEH